jgi:hypothetical protein
MALPLKFQTFFQFEKFILFRPFVNHEEDGAAGASEHGEEVGQ